MGQEVVKDIVGEIGAAPTCRTCGSQRVVKDAWACWNAKSAVWEIENVFDQEYCLQCDGETHFVWKWVEAVPNLRIRELNDKFRSEGIGTGSVVVTAGIKAEGHAFLRKVAEAVQSFAAFDDNNDPWGEHDFGAVDVEDLKVFWKIDYYTPDLTAGSENPANESQTHRVLTIMLASEY